MLMSTDWWPKRCWADGWRAVKSYIIATTIPLTIAPTTWKSWNRTASIYLVTCGREMIAAWLASLMCPPNALADVV